MVKLVYYAVIFFTGACSLAYQVVWQKYLGLLVGSEAKSSTITVAIFLLGLAIGYYYFGNWTNKVRNRKKLLQSYGLIELVTGTYLIFFPQYFEIIFNSKISSYNIFWSQVVLSALLCLIPAILMGATIPIMTAVLPQKESEINRTHSYIYGINTLGAFIGVLSAGLFVVPIWGYESSLIFFGSINCIISFVYIKNNLKGSTVEKTNVRPIDPVFNKFYLYLLGFAVGVASMALEIMWFRILGLTIGASYLVFPMVVSIFVLAIGMGSISLKTTSNDNFLKNLVLTMFFIVMSGTLIPYLPLTISNIRVLLASNEINYYLFHLIVYLILLITIFPGIFFLGRLLPYTFVLIPKTKENYGHQCGILYFINTVGTFLGATFIAYGMLFLLDIDQIYKLVVILVFSSSLYFFMKPIRPKLIFSSTVLLSIMVGQNWSRHYHISGLFRKRVPNKHIHFKNIITETNKTRETGDNSKVLYFKDGPNTTVGVTQSNFNPFKFPIKVNNHVDHKLPTVTKSIFVNGKSDGSTTGGDSYTSFLLALFPYLIKAENKLKTSVIGIGTGVTAGIMSKMKRIEKVDVIEISDAVIRSTNFLSPENYNFFKKEHVNIFKMDAFQFYKSKKNKYDIIVSVPSNLWVVGVENLFTDYFYKIIKKSIKSSGVFAQWFHTYSMSSEIIITILKNLQNNFSNIRVFRTSLNNIAFLASNSNHSLRLNPELANEKIVQHIFRRINVDSVEELQFLEQLAPNEVVGVIKTKKTFYHDIYHPSLSQKAYYAFFLGKKARKIWSDKPRRGHFFK